MKCVGNMFLKLNLKKGEKEENEIGLKLGKHKYICKFIFWNLPFRIYFRNAWREFGV